MLLGLCWWREHSPLGQLQVRGPGSHSQVRTPRTPRRDSQAPSWPAQACRQPPSTPPRCPPAPSPGQPMPVVEPPPAGGGPGPGLHFGGDGHLPLLCRQLSPKRPHPARPDAGPSPGPGPSARRPLLPAHPLCRRGLSRRPPPLAAAAPALRGCLRLRRLRAPSLGPCRRTTGLRTSNSLVT